MCNSIFCCKKEFILQLNNFATQNVFNFRSIIVNLVFEVFLKMYFWQIIFGGKYSKFHLI